MTKQEFLSSLSLSKPADHFDDYWRALWFIHKDDWEHAHDIVDGPPGSTFAWMHAVVHLMEGDDWNARYWFRIAGKSTENLNIEAEKEMLLDHLLAFS